LIVKLKVVQQGW